MNEERKVKYGFLHCHTDESNRDSVMTVETLVKRAAELGAPAVALTDHGVMTGYLRFAEECAKYDINAILVWKLMCRRMQNRERAQRKNVCT